MMANRSSEEIRAEIDAQDPWPDHRGICTFAVKLPFPLRLPDASEFTINLEATFADPADSEAFGEQTWVRIRLLNRLTGGIEVWGSDSVDVLRGFYGTEEEVPPLPLWQAGLAYDQWISLETPSGRLAGESEKDGAYHFHRCLRSLNLFLQAHLLVFRDSRVHQVTTPELSPIFYAGLYELDGRWSLQMPIFTHPETLPVFTEHVLEGHDFAEMIQRGVVPLQNGNPFVASAILSLRAHHAHNVQGDYGEAVISLATSMESRLFAIWRCLLVDLGYTGTEIDSVVSQDAPYRTLIVTTLPQLIGGRWDIAAHGSVVGDYWSDLYLLRNRIVHAGYFPTPGESERAREVHDALRDFVRECLWASRQKFPRATAFYIPPDVMEKKGWTSAQSSVLRATFEAEPAPYFLPWDLVGRQAPKPLPKPLRPSGRK
jgi:hypothetical protein